MPHGCLQPITMPMQTWRQIMLCIRACYWHPLSPSQNTAEETGRHHMHHRLMTQTLYKLQTVCTKHCLHDTTSARELRGINQADLSPSTSVCEDMQAPAQHPPFGLPLQLHYHLPWGLLYLEWISCTMHAYDGWIAPEFKRPCVLPTLKC